MTGKNKVVAVIVGVVVIGGGAGFIAYSQAQATQHKADFNSACSKGLPSLSSAVSGLDPSTVGYTAAGSAAELKAANTLTTSSLDSLEKNLTPYAELPEAGKALAAVKDLRTKVEKYSTQQLASIEVADNDYFTAFGMKLSVQKLNLKLAGKLSSATEKSTDAAIANWFKQGEDFFKKNRGMSTTAATSEANSLFQEMQTALGAVVVNCRSM